MSSTLDRFQEDVDPASHLLEARHGRSVQPPAAATTEQSPGETEKSARYPL